MYAMGTGDLFVLLLCFLIHLGYRHRRRGSVLLPPGPYRWPVFGNAFMIPSTNVPIFYKQLGEKLGE